MARLLSFLKVSWDKLYRIPNDYPFEKVALVGPSAVAYHAIGRAGCSLGDTIVVQGAGPIGLLVAMIVRIAGVSNIIVTEVQRFSLGIAEEMGFTVIDGSHDDVVKEVKRITEGRGADVVFTAAPVKETAIDITRLIRPHGKVVIFALFKEPTAVDLLNLSFTEGYIYGSRVYTPVDFERTVRMVVSGELQVEPLITHRMSLHDVEKGIQLVKSGEDVMKVILSP